MTCLVAQHVGTGDEHWAIRDKVSMARASTVTALPSLLPSHATHPGLCCSTTQRGPHLQAAAIVSHIVRRAHNDALVAALARVQQSLASAMFADSPSTRYGESCHLGT